MTRREEVEHMARRAKEFLRTADYQAKEGMYALAIFSLEQALQLLLKSRLIQHGVDYPRTHSLRRLLTMLATVDDKSGTWINDILRNKAVELSLLEDAYITSRYLLKEFGEEEYRRIKTLTEEVIHNL